VVKIARLMTLPMDFTADQVLEIAQGQMSKVFRHTL
jgi:hypothetical protein